MILPLDIVTFKKPKPEVEKLTSCQYCEAWEQFKATNSFGLGPVFPIKKEEHSGLDKHITFTYWHEELYQDAPSVPKKKIRCQLSS
jgi:hypothetical protein